MSVMAIVDVEPHNVVSASGSVVALYIEVADTEEEMIMVGVAKEPSGAAHDVTIGTTFEKMLASAAMSRKGGGRSGKATLSPTSADIDKLASTRTSGPILVRVVEESSVLLAYGAPGMVALLLLLLQYAAEFVDNLASRRGRLKETVTSALSLSANSNPTGMVGLNARPNFTSTSVTLVLKGKGFKIDSGKPPMPLFPTSVNSTRIFESLGT